jgi:sec-independent protein translocase protein TatA
MTSFLGFFIPSGPEIWIILAIFLLMFGHRIPKMARSMGSGIVEFKRGLKDPDSAGDDKDSDSDASADSSQDSSSSNG